MIYRLIAATTLLLGLTLGVAVARYVGFYGLLVEFLYFMQALAAMLIAAHGGTEKLVLVYSIILAAWGVSLISTILATTWFYIALSFPMSGLYWLVYVAVWAIGAIVLLIVSVAGWEISKDLAEEFPPTKSEK